MPSTAPPPSSKLHPLAPFQPDLCERAWLSAPHPTLPLLATAHARAVTVFSLATLSSHSALTGGHERSVRSVAWKPQIGGGGEGEGEGEGLCLVTASFDSTAALWRWQGGSPTSSASPLTTTTMTTTATKTAPANDTNDPPEWEFTLVLDGHDSEIKSAVFSPSGIYLATCSRDKSVWIWEDVGATPSDDEWETVAVLNEHDGDVKAVAWCPDVPGRVNGRRRRFGADALASASYDGAVRVWREDFDGDWVCVAVLEGHGGTVWGVQWESRPRRRDAFPRLLSWSADGTVRVWTLDEPEGREGDDSRGDAGGGRLGGLGGIPNTMRASLRETWNCTAVLPAVHTKDVYSACWSAKSGMVASVGSDGVLALYAEDNDHDHNHDHDVDGQLKNTTANAWRVLATMDAAHGPYEINHVTWCPRHDAGCENKGVEEMLVTTGDDGVVRPWRVELGTSTTS